MIKEKLSTAEAILNAPYDGFVEVRGEARQDYFRFLKVKSKSSYLDDRWEESTHSNAEQVDTTLNMVTSSMRFKPSATAYIVIYKDGVEGVNTAGARQVNVTDGRGDYMALLIIKQKAPKGNIAVRSGSINKVGKAGNSVYKFTLDRLKPRSKRSLGIKLYLGSERNMAATSMELTMNVVRIYTGSDGASHFEDVEIAMEERGVGGRLSALIPGPGVIFREVGGDYDLDFHTAPRRQFVINLKGSVDITVGDGTTRRLGSGEILLAEDTAGQGHKSSAVNGQSRTCLFVPIDDDAAL